MPDTFCPGKFLQPITSFHEQISKMQFLENRITGQKTGFRYPGKNFWSKTSSRGIQIQWYQCYSNLPIGLAEIALVTFMYVCTHYQNLLLDGHKNPTSYLVKPGFNGVLRKPTSQKPTYKPRFYCIRSGIFQWVFKSWI